MKLSAQKYSLIIYLILNCFNIWGQTDTDNYDKIEHQCDSLSLWSYDFVDIDKPDSLIICKIVFFRNEPIADKVFEKVYGYKKYPGITYSVYPVSMIDSVRKMSRHVQMFSSCVPPSVGGDYHILNDFVLINYTSCVNCASTDNKLDLCRGNVKAILKPVSKDNYLSFADLCSSLPIDKKVKPNYHQLPKQISKITKDLTKENMIIGRATGFAGEERPSYKSFKKLVEKATKADLIKLTENKSPIVRGYAYWGLLLTDKEYILANRIRYSQDTEWVETNLHGCISTPYKIRDFVEMLLLIPDEQMAVYYER